MREARDANGQRVRIFCEEDSTPEKIRKIIRDTQAYTGMNGKSTQDNEHIVRPKDVILFQCHDNLAVVVLVVHGFKNKMKRMLLILKELRTLWSEDFSKCQ